MRRKNQSDTSDTTTQMRKAGSGWGPFTGGQLTIIVCVAIIATVAIPTVALAATGEFTSSSNTIPAVKGINYGTHGIGVQGRGNRFGVYSNGPLGVASGKDLVCTGCVSGGDLAPSARTYCSGYPHPGVDWSLPGSTAGHGCDLSGANLTDARLASANLTNANLTGAILTGANLQTGANLTGANLTDARGASRLDEFGDPIDVTALDTATLIGADLTHAHFKKATFTETNLTSATLLGADLSYTNMYAANLNAADLTGADLTGALGTNATTVGTVWSNTICPDGTNSDNDGSTCVGNGHGF